MKIQRIKGVAWRKVGDEMVVIHLARHRIFGLDSTAERIWESLEEPQSLATLGEIASSDLPEEPNVIDAVGRFVADLAEEGLVDIEGEGFDATYGDNVVDFVKPRIEWREDLQQFAGQCHLVPGQSHQCNQHPGGS